jgi:hypothetical protein
MIKTKRTKICLTPCRNEEWILDTFLAAASLWADYIIIGDQASTDSSRDIIKGYPKAVLAENTWAGFGYHQGHYQKVVLDTARQIPGEKILFTLDADELLTADAVADANLWRRLDEAPLGTPIYGSWVNICPGFKTGFNFGGDFLIGAVDGPSVSTHSGKHHVPRLKVAVDSVGINIAPSRVMHYQFTDLARYRSKQRFYAVVEWVEKNGQRPYDLYRRLHPFETNTKRTVYPLRAKWIRLYNELGVDWMNVSIDGSYRWDSAVLDALLEHGTSHFKKLDIWDHDWKAQAAKAGIPNTSLRLNDPRRLIDKFTISVLRKTQPLAHSLLDRAIRQMCRFVGY